MSVLDHKKLAVIHIVKRELNLGDQEYRDLLEQAAGVRSARDLDEEGFRRLMRFFARSRHYQANRGGLTLRQKLFIDHLVAELGWDPGHLANFDGLADSVDFEKQGTAIGTVPRAAYHLKFPD